jgi:hypothetical protein
MVYWYAPESAAVFWWETEAMLASQGNGITLLLTRMPLETSKLSRWQVYSIQF